MVAGQVNVQVGVPAATNAATTANSQPALTLQQSISTLSNQPGMGYLATLNSNAAQVNWSEVELAHKSWNYKQQGLTPEGAAIVSAVVIYFTAGTASSWGAAVGNGAAVGAGEGVALAGGGTFLTGTGATISGVVGGAATAGFTTLATQASISLINNQGDLGKTLHDLGSSQSVRNLVTAMLTGGVLQGLDLNPTGQATANSGGQQFMTQLGQNLKASAASALINTAINGGSLEDNLAQALKAGLLDTVAAQGANFIGDATANDFFTNKVAHAMAGCAVGAARTNGSCSAGALGAAIGEIAAEAYGKKPDTVQLASMVSAIAVAVAGGDASQIALGGAAGGNAAANNYLNHIRPAMLRLSERERYDAAVAACGNGDQAACGTRDELAATSRQRDRDLAQACTGATPGYCNDLKSQAIAMGNTVYTTANGFTYANSPTQTSLNVSTIGPASDPRTGSFHDTVARSTAEGLVLEVGNQALGALVGIATQGVGATTTAVTDFFASQGIAITEGTAARIASNFGREGDSFTTAAEQMVAAKNSNWLTPTGKTWWPPGSGNVPGTEFQTTLGVGTRLDRYGGTGANSTFLAPSNTPLGQRALSPTTNTAVRDEYVVLRPLPVEQSNTMPWFGQQGMGVQFDTSKEIGMTIPQLIEQGFLRKVSL